MKELSTVEPYTLDGMKHTVSVTADATAELELKNETAKGQIRIEKRGNVLTGTTASDTEYGQLHVPTYTEKGLPGCVYTVKDSNGTVIATLTTDENGIAETGLLALGVYTVQETATVSGFVLDDTVHTVTLQYQDQNTPIVKHTIQAVNERIPTSIRIKKMTEFFNKTNMEFERGPLAGVLFGVFAAENIGSIPKNTMVDLLMTNGEGIATSTSVLPVGNYYLRELSVPDRTIHLLSETLPLALTGHSTQYFDTPIFNERFKGNIGIYRCKVSAKISRSHRH